MSGGVPVMVYCPLLYTTGAEALVDVGVTVGEVADVEDTLGQE